jgi:hypothetical protein
LRRERGTLRMSTRVRTPFVRSRSMNSGALRVEWPMVKMVG